MSALRTAALAFVAGLLFLIGPAYAAPQFPKLTGPVVDEAGILSPAIEISLAQKLEALKARTGREVTVATLKSLQGYEIADYGYQLGRHWGLGSKEKDDGAVFIIAPNDRKLRIELGYGLEGVLTDALSSVIINTQVVPKFRQGDFEGGIVAGTDAIIQQLMLDAPEAKARVAEAEQRQQSDDEGMPWWLVVAIVIFFVFMRGGFSSLMGGGRRRGRRSGWRRGRDDDDDWGSAAVLGGILGGLGGRGGGGGFGGGGSWGGGGGGFGGGGASGSW